jgi:hypothetical protein
MGRTKNVTVTAAAAAAVAVLVTLYPLLLLFFLRQMATVKVETSMKA